MFGPATNFLREEEMKQTRINSDADIDLIKELFASDGINTVNPIFFAIFNSLGVLPAIYAALLLPGSRDQSGPAPGNLARRRRLPRHKVASRCLTSRSIDTRMFSG